MAFVQARTMRALVIGLLVVLLLGVGAVPVAAGGPGGPGQRGAAGPQGQQGSGGPSAQQVQGSPAPRKTSSAPRAARKQAARPAARQAATPPKPSAAKPPAPAPKARQHRSDRAHPHEVEEPDTELQMMAAPAPAPRTQVRTSTAVTPIPDVDRRPRTVRAPVAARPPAPVVASSADPTTALLAGALAAPVDLDVADRSPRLWPPLPGPVGHPAFPGLLAAVLVALVVLGCRGDRRDPKLAAAAIDDRDDRALFR